MADNLSGSTGSTGSIGSNSPHATPQLHRMPSKKKFHIFHLHSTSSPNLKSLVPQQPHSPQHASLSPKSKDDLHSSANSVANSGPNRKDLVSSSPGLNGSYGSDSYSPSPARSPPNSPRSNDEWDGADIPLSKSVDSSPVHSSSNGGSAQASGSGGKSKKTSRFAGVIRRVKHHNKLKKEIAEMSLKSGLTQQYTTQKIPFNEIAQSPLAGQSPGNTVNYSGSSKTNRASYGSQRRSRFIEPIDASTDDYSDIPKAIKLSIEYLFEKALKVPGLFRESANTMELQRLKRAMASSDSVDLSDYKEPHNVGGLLKHYLRERSTPVFPYTLHKQVAELYDSNVDNQQEISGQLKDLLKIELSKGQYLILRYLFELLHAVALNEAFNKMSAYNLAVCFAPTLTHSFDSTCINIVTKLIDDYEIIFGVEVPVEPSDGNNNNNGGSEIVDSNGSLDVADNEADADAEAEQLEHETTPVKATVGTVRRRKRSNTRMVKLSVLYDQKLKPDSVRITPNGRPTSWHSRKGSSDLEFELYSNETSSETSENAADDGKGSVGSRGSGRGRRRNSKSNKSNVGNGSGSTRGQRTLSNGSSNNYKQEDVPSLLSIFKVLKEQQKQEQKQQQHYAAEQAEVTLSVAAREEEEEEAIDSHNDIVNDESEEEDELKVIPDHTNNSSRTATATATDSEADEDEAEEYESSDELNSSMSSSSSIRSGISVKSSGSGSITVSGGGGGSYRIKERERPVSIVDSSSNPSVKSTLDSIKSKHGAAPSIGMINMKSSSNLGTHKSKSSSSSSSSPSYQNIKNFGGSPSSSTKNLHHHHHHHSGSTSSPSYMKRPSLNVSSRSVTSPSLHFNNVNHHHKSSTVTPSKHNYSGSTTSSTSKPTAPTTPASTSTSLLSSSPSISTTTTTTSTSTTKTSTSTSTTPTKTSLHSQSSSQLGSGSSPHPKPFGVVSRHHESVKNLTSIWENRKE